MTRKRAFSYIRMSTETQMQGHSLERQLDLTRAYAKEKEFDLIEDLRDIGLSAHDGSNVEKGRLGEFLEALEKGEIEKDCVLLVESLDRLSRKNPFDAFNQFSKILSYGIEIHTIFDRQSYNYKSVSDNPGQLFSSIGYMLRAYSESEEKSKRLKKRWERNRENLDSRILTSLCPAWLKPNADKTGFEEYPDRVAIVRKIFDLCIDEGMGTYSIARYLNEHIEKYPRFTLPKKKNRSARGNHGTGWQKSYISKILHNPAVHGEFRPHKMENGKQKPTDAVHPNYFPAIISRERYLLAQSRLSGRNLKGGGRKGKVFNNVFTKLVFCQNCGGSVHFIDKGAPPKGGKYLRCYNAISNHNCNYSAWRYQDFENSFLDFVSDVEFAAALQKGNDKSRKSKLLDRQQINAEEIKHKRAYIDKLLAFEETLSSEAFANIAGRIEQVTVELRHLNEEKQEIISELADIQARNSQKAHDKIVAAVRQAEQAATDQERATIRRIIHNQISAIVDKIEIDGLSPDDNFDARNFTVIFKNGETLTVFPHKLLDYKQGIAEWDWETHDIKITSLEQKSSHSVRFINKDDSDQFKKNRKK